jgi:hypothetical protein
MDINTSVSPEVHPQVVSGLISDHVTKDDALVATTRGALESIYKTLGSIAAARHELDELARSGLQPTDSTRRLAEHGLSRMVGGRQTVTTPHNQLVEAGNKAIEVASGKADHAYGQLQKAEAALELSITDGLRDLAFGQQVAVETRAMLRGEQDPAKRLGMVMSAAQKGDLPMVAAILSAPAYLSGLTDEQRTLVRETAAHAVVPQLKARRDAARKAQELLRRAGGHLIEELGVLKRYQQTGAARVSAAVAAIGAE